MFSQTGAYLRLKTKDRFALAFVLHCALKVIVGIGLIWKHRWLSLAALRGWKSSARHGNRGKGNTQPLSRTVRGAVASVIRL
ncbi:hypothetical protein DKP76_10565 [Falsochrobactrum shanghaiense]|uniref:Uncharacterized protein n=1 Tax=Falsochrobactrum shanghaiense TaxID=2201899 RepID=A0A316JG08_9HYPH|nr:hypothetical protein DKP76_10565 [Falsochrobactrum shanghaiense]